MKSEIFNELGEKPSSSLFAKQNSKMLKVTLNGNEEIAAAAGSVVAYQGDLRFSYRGAGGVAKKLKQVVSGEDAHLMRITGRGEAFIANNSQNIFIVDLHGDGVSVQSDSLLAFDASLNHDIVRNKSVGGVLGGGLFNVVLSGHGSLVLTTVGEPVLLSTQQTTCVDPQAVVAWSANLNPSIKNDASTGLVIGRGSGESIQMVFQGDGWVLVQPYERINAGSSSSSNGGNGILGDVMNGIFS